MRTKEEIEERMNVLKDLYDQSTRDDETRARIQAGYLALRWATHGDIQ